MKHNPKVVPFNRSAAYVHHRALKNLRDNNPIDALELMRHAVEHSPENQEYRLDLAEMYCEMGYHEQSNRILLDMIAGENPPAECYYGLALNQFGKRETESARRALGLYRKYATEEEYDQQDVIGFCCELDLYDYAGKSSGRKAERAARIAQRACSAMRENDLETAVRLFRRSLSLIAGQPGVRALYAMALKLCGDEKGALKEAEKAVQTGEKSVRALCLAAQVYNMCGRREEAGRLAMQAIELRPGDVKLRLLAFVLCELGMYAEASEAIKRALRETPYAREMLHLRAVAMHKQGAADDQVEPFWLRILRIDPKDSIAQYYHDMALAGRLGEIEPELVYQVPAEEFRRRLREIAQALNAGLESAAMRWREDREFRKLLIWAAETQEEACGEVAVMVIASAGDAESESVLRELLYRVNMPLQVKQLALRCLRWRGADLARLIPPDVMPRDGMLPEPDTLLADLSVGERQLVRLAADRLEEAFGVRVVSALAVMWKTYREGVEAGRDPLINIGEAAAALAWNYCLKHGFKVTVRRLSTMFDCKIRKMVFYARHMAAVLERVGSGQNQ